MNNVCIKQCNVSLHNCNTHTSTDRCNSLVNKIQENAFTDTVTLVLKVELLVLNLSTCEWVVLVYVSGFMCLVLMGVWVFSTTSCTYIHVYTQTFMLWLGYRAGLQV